MRKLTSIALVVSSVAAVAAHTPQEEFVHPREPLSPTDRAPSPKVTNGTVFESGALELAEGQRLVLPEDAVVETHDGGAVRFFLTKSQWCAGQPPAPMRFDETRRHYGIAERSEESAIVVSTFGEWTNRGGSARIRMLVLVPRNVEIERREALSGPKSAASSSFNPGDEELEDAYWYAGPRPVDGWQEIETSLHFSRFLRP